MKVVFKDKNGDSHLKNTLEEYFPKLKSQNRAFELLRADRGGNTRLLLSIHMPNTGYTIKYLKDAVPGSVVIYVRPIQSDLTRQLSRKKMESKFPLSVLIAKKMFHWLKLKNIQMCVKVDLHAAAPTQQQHSQHAP